MKRNDTKSWYGTEAPNSLTGISLLSFLPEQPKHITCAIWSSDGKYLLTSCIDGSLRIWTPSPVKCVIKIQAHKHPIYALAWHPSKDIILTGGCDNLVKIWRMADSSLHLEGELCEHNDDVKEIFFSKDGRTLITASVDYEILVWDFASRLLRKREKPSNERLRLSCMTPSPDEKYLAVGTVNGGLEILDYKNIGFFKHLSNLNSGAAHNSTIYDISWHPQKPLIASCSGDRLVKIWDLNHGRCLEILEGHTGKVVTVGYSCNGNLLVTHGQDMVIKVWDTQFYTTFEQLNFQCQDRPEPYLSFHPEISKFISLGKSDLSVRVWGIEEDALMGHYLKVERWRNPLAWMRRLLRKVFPLFEGLDPRTRFVFGILSTVLSFVATVITIIQVF